MSSSPLLCHHCDRLSASFRLCRAGRWMWCTCARNRAMHLRDNVMEYGKHSPGLHLGPVPIPGTHPSISNLHFPGRINTHLPYSSREISLADATKLPSQEQSSLDPLIIQSYKGALRCDWKVRQPDCSGTNNERHNVSN